MKSIRMNLNRSIVIILLIIAAAPGWATSWKQSYKSGYTDKNGHFCGGSEIMHIVAHKGKLYAFNGYWKDRNFGKYSAQVLRLDSPEGQWQVDLDTNKNGLGYTAGNIRHMKGNILKSVTFTTDTNGKKINVNLLVAASWAWDVNDKRDQGTSIFVRDDKSEKWNHTIIQAGSSHITIGGKKHKVRRVPRDIEIYHDRVTETDRIFLLGGDTGIFSGTYNSTTGEIERGPKPEHPKDKPFNARPLGITEANGRLYFSIGGMIFMRKIGPKPSWQLAHTQSSKGVNTEMGGIRGLSTVPNPNGPGDSLIFVWTARGRSPGEIIRLDGPELKPAKESSLRTLYNTFSPHKESTHHSGALGGYNRFLPVNDPRTGKTVHLVGFQQTIGTDNASLKQGHYYKGGMYGIRINHTTYSGGCINGKWEKGKPVLVAPRAYAVSPFPEEKGTIYFGGYDSNFMEATGMAWIFKADIETVLYRSSQ